jgi:hypothetical protein
MGSPAASAANRRKARANWDDPLWREHWFAAFRAARRQHGDSTTYRRQAMDSRRRAYQRPPFYKES